MSKPTQEGLPRRQSQSLFAYCRQALLSLGLPLGEAPNQPGNLLLYTFKLVFCGQWAYS